ncbi:MAG: radical SAM protein [Christensenellaceae bacterium]|nr:radical SAM protein [Christensenellaceae bacterium]
MWWLWRLWRLIMFCDNTSRLLLQFHITGRCNLRCKHCYRNEGDIEPLNTKTIFKVIDQFVVLRKRYNQIHGIDKKAHINITGGEPFIREDIDQILAYLGAFKEEISFGVLSNGSFLHEKRIETLKDNHVSFVQLSIDGNREIHDSLRAHGDYDRTFKTARILEESGIRTYISFTANYNNYKYLPHVASQCRKYGISKLWTDRMVAIGHGEELQTITKEHLQDYLKAIKKAQGNWLKKHCYPKTKVTADRALQFLGTEGKIYSCSAGKSLITVDEFGRVMPCRRMPIICGNVFDSTLEKIYFESDVLRSLRKNTIPNDCRDCKFAYYCKGGAKCQAYAAYGNFYKADPGCFLPKQ